MTSDPRYTPTEHWYVPKTGERSTIGQKKIDELQRQILHMENDRKQRELLRQKLDRMQVVQDEKREMEEKVLERNSRNNTPKNSRNNTPRLLQSEMERLYGRDSQLDRNKSPGLDKNVIQTVIKHRTKEFSQKQQEAALKAKYLDKERQRLVEARRRVEEQRRALVNTMSPTGKHEITFHNDKPLLPYMPYHFFENKAERMCNSFVLPITKEFPKKDNWKLKIKFVAMPAEDSDQWNKYKDQITKEEEHGAVDEAVQAFQSFTENKQHFQKHAYPKIRYVPQFTADGEIWHSAKHRPKAQNNFKDYSWKQKMKNYGLSQSAHDFRESFKYPSTHYQYRTPKHRDKNKYKNKRKNKDLEHIDYIDLNRYEELDLKKDFSVKQKVRFRPTPSGVEPYGSKVHYWMERNM